MVCWRRKCYSSYIFFRCRFFVYFCKLSLKSALLQNLDSPFWILEPWVLDFYLWIALIKKEASQAKYHFKMCQFRRKIIHKLTVNCLLILLTKKNYPGLPSPSLCLKSPQKCLILQRQIYKFWPFFIFKVQMCEHLVLKIQLCENSNETFLVIFNHCVHKILITLLSKQNNLHFIKCQRCTSYLINEVWMYWTTVKNVFSQIIILCLHFQGQMGVIF